MTSQRTAHGRFQRAIQRRNLFQAELAIREKGMPSLPDALAYLPLLADACGHSCDAHGRHSCRELSN